MSDELRPVQITIDVSPAPTLWGIFQDRFGTCSLWRRPIFGASPKWVRIPGPVPEVEE